jgi:predicted ester cyclase
LHDGTSRRLRRGGTRWKELLTEDYVEHGAFDLGHHGVAADRGGIEQLLAAFPDAEATVADVVAEGATVAMRVTLRATHEGAVTGSPATRRRVEVGDMAFGRIRGGSIAERWVHPDAPGMVQQLGVIDPSMPRPGAAETGRLRTRRRPRPAPHPECGL